MAENDIEFNAFLTKKELFKLIESVRHDGQIDEAEAERLVNWATEKLTGATVVSLLMDGYLVVDGWDGDNPHTVPPKEAIEFMKDFEAENVPLLEESRC